MKTLLLALLAVVLIGANPPSWSEAEFFGMDAKRERAAKDGVKAWIDPDGYAARIKEKLAAFSQLSTAEAPP